MLLANLTFPNNYVVLFSLSYCIHVFTMGLSCVDTEKEGTRNVQQPLFIQHQDEL
jgi:hypothetical protein